MKAPPPTPPAAKAQSAFRQIDGPLTQELVLRPGAFGLGQVPARLEPDATTTTVCGYCSTGCGLNVHLRKGQAINLSAAAEYPVNLGMACPKGWEALTPLRAPDRATSPLLRNPQGEFEAVGWEAALQVFVDKFKSIQREHGPDALAWLGTGQITTEELAFLGALGKMGMGIRHGDGNTRQCMATAVTAYKESFGFDAPPYTYADLEESDVLVFVGSNLCIAHPILWQRVLRNPHQPKILVVDPRKTETAMAATAHYAIRPKSDLVLLYGLANLLQANGWINQDYIAGHTNGFAAFEKFVQHFTPELVSKATGLSSGQLQEFAQTIHHGRRVSFWWTMGVNQGHEATRTAQAIINLALMTGHMGRPGTGANSITGQCNAMGSRLFSNTTNLLGGHDFKNAVHRQKLAQVLGMDSQLIPQENSWAYDQIVQGIADGKIKGLWIVGTNASHSWIHQNQFNELLGRLEWLVVQDMFASTETAQLAHLVLPAAGWGEKEGTFINSERRIGHVKKVARAPGQALADFHIFQLVAQAWGCGELFAEWSSPEAVFRLLKETSRGQPCDITGIRDYAQIDAEGGIQWPLPDHAANEPPTVPAGPQNGLNADPIHPRICLGTPSFPGGGSRKKQQGPGLQSPAAQVHAPECRTPIARERRLFADGKYFHPDGKARFLFEQPRALPEATDEQYPFLLLTGRGTSAQWHTGTRTEKSHVLRKLRPERVYVELNPRDAERLGVKTQALVRVRSRRGEFTATAFVTPTIQPGQVFVPMHYAATNQLTLAAFDPYSRQPAYKSCAVQLLCV